MAGQEKGGSYDETKGRLRKAWGEATGDEEQKQKGTVEKATGKLKEGIDRTSEKAKEMFDRDNK